MITPLIKQLKSLLAQGDYEGLKNLDIKKVEKVNWVRDVFEGINLVERPDARALVWTDGKQTLNYSFRDLSIRYNKLLNFLRDKGVQQGDVMMTQLMLQPINWTALLATVKGGLRLVPTASIMGVTDLMYRFEKTLPKVIISDPQNADKIDEAAKRMNIDIAVKIIAEGEREGWYSLSALDNYSAEAEAADTNADDILFMFYTSGTTGMPKVVCHSHSSYPLGIMTVTSWIGIQEDDLHYNISQPGWAKFAWSSVFAPWNMGAAIFAYHTYDRFNAATTMRLLETHKVNTLCAPPTVYRLLIQEELKHYNLSLKQCVAAGEPLNPEVIEQWKLGTGVEIRDGYGQSESTAMVANLPNQPVKYGSMGKPTFMFDIVIADDDGKEVGVDEEGNICVRTNAEQISGLFLQYLYDKERFAKVFRDGLYFTGDKAYKDADGYVWFVGRDDDVIKASDYRVGPFEVESVLIEHESILESAVVGSPHPIKGFEIKAFVILTEGHEPSEALADDIFTYCRNHMAPYKMPRIIEFVKELPKTISGKIRRIELRAQEGMNKAKKITGEFEYYYKK